MIAATLILANLTAGEALPEQITMPSGSPYALVLVVPMPDAATCGEAILRYVGQGDVFCIGKTLAPATSLIPRPRPQRP